MISPFALNLRHLRALEHVVRLGSLNRAAEAAGISQPALTQGLGKMERLLGVALFERHSGGMTPTDAGRVLAGRAARAFDCLSASSPRPGRAGQRGFARPEWLMTATQLDAFRHFADAQSFAGAAAASGLSQPGIHRAVRELEQICGKPLVERRGRGVVLTAAGRALGRGVRLAAAEIAAGIAEARGDDSDGGRVAVGAMPLSRAQLLPDALARFLAADPRSVVDVTEGSWRDLIDPLLDGVIDLMVGALRDPPPPGVVQVALATDQLAIFGRAGHPLQGQAATLATLAGQQWIVGPPGTPLRAHWRALFNGAEPAVPVECGSVMVIRGLLTRSDFLTLLSPDQVALEVGAGVLARIGPELTGTRRTIGITMRAGWQPSRTQARFVDALHQAAKSTMVQHIG
ncbi:LysR family transcriptional regulator [Sphingomonas sp. BGYR3]|uniref:LysR family transcriptional regulator n=1 Tax=Sphingomonas sp. BGYR3 TaxID=2975483 RepID=UPI0021A814B2|nr:LysR family transcriptional regulator [Sphingomonas sp. BGYR3]MDG5489676.1 LysR family transcriptional regulator [Sphingomonas sp. BGYR3]